MDKKKPSLYTCLSPALLHLYDVSSSIVVIIDILRATSTIATALQNGAKAIIPVDSVPECIRIGKQIMRSLPANEMERSQKDCNMGILLLNIPKHLFRANPCAYHNQRHKIIAYGP